MTTTDDKRYLRVFAAYYFLAFIPLGVYVPYLPLFFQRSGRSDAEIGTLLAVSPLLMVLAPPVWGALADRLQDKKKVLLLLLAVPILLFPCLWFTRDFAVTLMAMTVVMFFMTPCEPLADAVTMEHLPRAGGDYGRLRLFGSLGYILPLLLMGLALGPTSGARVGVGSLAPIFITFAASRLVAALWAMRLPAGDRVPFGVVDFRALRTLVRGRFVALVACAFVSRVGTQTLFVFFSIYLDKLHMADNIKGYFWAIGVISEVLVMYFATRIMARTSFKLLFGIGLAATALRLFAFSFPLSFFAIALVAPLQGVAFAAFQVPTVVYINQVAPAHLRASSQALFAALVGGVGGVVGAQVSGAIAGAIGISALFRIMSLLVLAALVAFLVWFKPEAPAAADNGAR